jgi:hypothetical protein
MNIVPKLNIETDMPIVTKLEEIGGEEGLGVPVQD